MVSRILARRQALALLLGGGVVGLAACGSGVPAVPATRSVAVSSRAAAASVPAASTAQPASSAKPPATGQTAIVWSHPQDTPQKQAVYTKALAAFMQDNPTIAVSEISAPPAQYGQELETLIAGGVPPDAVDLLAVFATLPAFASKKALQPLTAYLGRAAPDVQQDQFWPQIWVMGTYQGVQYGLPWFGISLSVVYCNLTLLTTAQATSPLELASKGQWTWDSLREVAQQATKMDSAGKPTQYGFQEPTGALAWAEPLLWSYGGESVSADGKQALFDQPGSVDALGYMGDLATKFKVVPATNESNFTYEASGKLAMDIAWNARISTYRSYTFDWDVVPMPAGPTGAFTASGGDTTGIASGTKHPDEAWALVQYLAGPAGSYAIALGVGTVPARQSQLAQWKGEMAKQGPPKNLDAFDAMLKSARAYPVMPQWPRVEQVYQKEIGRLLDGSSTAKDIAATMTTEANAALREGT